MFSQRRWATAAVRAVRLLRGQSRWTPVTTALTLVQLTVIVWRQELLQLLSPQPLSQPRPRHRLSVPHRLRRNHRPRSRRASLLRTRNARRCVGISRTKNTDMQVNQTFEVESPSCRTSRTKITETRGVRDTGIPDV